MRSLSTNELALILGVCVLPGLMPSALGAQFVPSDVAAQTQQSSAQASTQDLPAASLPSGKLRVSQEVQLTGDSSWLDSGIDVQAGEHVVATANGSLRYADQQTDTAPTGVARGFKDLLRNLPFNEAGRGAVIGRIGEANFSRPFLIGTKRDTSPYLRDASRSASINSAATREMARTPFLSKFTPPMRIPSSTAKRCQTSVASTIVSFPRFRAASLASRRSPATWSTSNHRLTGLHGKVFNAAGWVKVDANVADTILHGLLESMSKESYLTMPMSPLYLFGRQQDYGWAHAEPISVVASRNHLRIWKAPFEVNEQMLWVGAATHDVGFEKDQRNNGVTHKIDPNVDLERDYVEKTLASTGLVDEITHILPANPMQEAKTATGGSFHSNGQVLVLKLGESPQKH
jgi:hypothetical protein